MIGEYINAALARATCEKIDENRKSYFGRVRGLRATRKTLEQCRPHLAEVIEGWLIVRLRKGLAIPPIGKHTVEPAKALRFGT